MIAQALQHPAADVINILTNEHPETENKESIISSRKERCRYAMLRKSCTRSAQISSTACPTNHGTSRTSDCSSFQKSSCSSDASSRMSRNSLRSILACFRKSNICESCPESSFLSTFSFLSRSAIADSSSTRSSCSSVAKRNSESWRLNSFSADRSDQAQL